MQNADQSSKQKLDSSIDVWLPQARCVASPNFNQRPPNTDISLLVIHNISLPCGQYGGPYIEQLFTNCLDCNAHTEFHDLQQLQVSSHLLIDRLGQLTQFVALNQRAWHAGESSFNGRENCNDYSLGIELEGTDESAYTAEQYACLVALSADLMRRFPAITAQRIVGHSDIAPQRKTDPGAAFDWDYYKRQLALLTEV